MPAHSSIYTEYYERLRSLIYNESGIHFNDSNRAILESRLRERLEMHKDLADLKAYYNFVRTNAEEFKQLLDAITTNLTRFFRNFPHYETLKNYVLPDLIKHKRKKGETRISLWSAGCSTGEEAYSNAIYLREYLPSDFSFSITASDISLSSLMTAKEGFYSKERCAEIPKYFLQKYFTAKNNGYVVKDSLKSQVIFNYSNLNFDNGLRNFDIIFCRNVLIYFDEVAQANVVKRFYQAMKDHSYLFIGHSESLFGMGTGFTFIKTDWACIYGKLLTTK